MKLTEQEVILYKKKLVKTFNEFDSFCKKHDIKYVAAGGTAIGAVRHHGIIPWDDDIDVIMTYDQYKKFLSLRNTLDGTDYVVYSPGDKYYGSMFSKFCDRNSTIWETPDLNYCFGVFVDVFPVYPAPGQISEVIKERNKYIKLFYKYRASIDSFDNKAFANLIQGIHVKGVFNYIYYRTIGRMFTQKYLKDFFAYEESLGKIEPVYYMPPVASYGIENEVMKKELFDDIIQMPFEDTTMPIFKEYDYYLTRLFGDYMTPPPPEKRISHHYHYFFDLEHGYTIDECKEIISHMDPKDLKTEDLSWLMK